MYPALLPLMRTPRLPAVDCTDVPADLNELVRFAERRNLVSARVPSHFNWPLVPAVLSVSFNNQSFRLPAIFTAVETPNQVLRYRSLRRQIYMVRLPVGCVAILITALFPYVLWNNCNSFVSSSFNGAATPALNSAKLVVHKSHRKPTSRLKIQSALQVT